MQGGESGLPAR